ncbi:hypothetical protein LCGC14_0520280 [marine sediment metagenome]|uniref:Uncharacterized protein n=1 Tax=marine sediment metagenome TaxID=412755 RepID=A0A0F9RYP0_9ZZZZ
MDPQTDQIAAIETNQRELFRAGRAAAEAGVMAAELGAALERRVALNTASIESFERTITDMQAQIDKLTREASDG